MTFSSSRDKILTHQDPRYYRFICPINLTVMADPVTTEDGQTYENTAIRNWFETQRAKRVPITSPTTGSELRSDALIPNAALKKEIDDFFKDDDDYLPNNAIEIQANDINFGLSIEIFKELDRIPTLLTDLDLPTPKIIVIGNESHGKSTLLERIIGLPIFPRATDLCTRCVIRVQLRRCAEHENFPAEISVVERGRNDAISEVVALCNIRQVIQNKMDALRAVSETGNEIIHDKEIVVKLRLHYALNLDILDLPGLVAANPRGTMQDVRAATTELAMRVIEENREFAIFLLVNDIKVADNQSRGAEIIERAGLQKKTIGVFTKIDTMVNEDAKRHVAVDLVERLNSALKSSFHIPQGWLACSSQRIAVNAQVAANGLKDELADLVAIDSAEQQQIHERFSDVPKSRIGIQAIKQKLQTSYERFIVKEWVPAIIRKIQTPRKEMLDAIIAMGMPMADRDEYRLFNIPGLSTLTCDQISDDLNKRIESTLSKMDTWLEIEKNKEFWNAMKSYKELVESISTKTECNRRAVALIQEENVEKLKASLFSIVDILKASAKNIIKRMLADLNKENNGESTITILRRLTSVQQHVKNVAVKQFDDLFAEFSIFFTNYCEQVFIKDNVTKLFNQLFTMEYHCEGNTAVCSLEVKDVVRLNEIPNVLFHHWATLVDQCVGGLPTFIRVTRKMIQTESCFEDRLHRLDLYSKYKKVYEAIVKFYIRVTG
jgi:hypothetical protein